LNEIDDALADLSGAIAAHVAAPDADDDEPRASLSPQVFLNRLSRGGETAIAGKALNALRTSGARGLHAIAEVEEMSTRVGAIRKAAAYRRFNEANASNEPLPAWVRVELKKMGVAEAERLAAELGVKI
jgi:hypothetical protein